MPTATGGGMEVVGRLVTSGENIVFLLRYQFGSQLAVMYSDRCAIRADGLRSTGAVVSLDSCEIQMRGVNLNSGVPRMRILVVEDDPKMALLLRDALEKHSHRIILAANGREGLDIGRNHEFESIVLDVMLPEMDGYSVARALREGGVSTPILMLTARDSTTDVVKGLDSGVDDYMTKPFAFEELFARLRALARRQIGGPSLQYMMDDLRLDPKTHLASRSGSAITLTRTEYLLLEFMMRNPHEVLRRDAIINAVWGYERTVENNTLDAFMKQLRAKIDGDSDTKLIHTVRGFGYKLTPGKA